MKIRFRRSGFTLPEILVTVTVVAVLAAVVVPAVTQYINKGDAPASSQDVNQIRAAVTGYVSDTRHYPAYFLQLLSDPGNVTGWKGPYFAGQLSGATATATFSSAGSNVTFGSSFSQSPVNHVGYLTTSFTPGTGMTCQDLWNLDHTLDGSTPSAANAATNAAAGTLQWAGSCAATSTPTDLVATGFTSGTLRVTAIGG